MKIEIDNIGMVVDCRQPDWRTAGDSANDHFFSPPDGYKCVEYRVRRRSKTGKAVNLRLSFDWNDDRVPAFTLPEAYEYFQGLEPGKGAG